MMNCPWCHKETSDGAHYCAWCGLKIPPPEEIARMHAERHSAQLQSTTVNNPVWAPRPPEGCNPDPAMLRPLSIGEIFDHAFSIYRRNFGRLTAVFAAVLLPATVFEAAMSLARYSTDGPVGSKVRQIFGSFEPTLLFSMFFVAGLCFANAAAAKIASDDIIGTGARGGAAVFVLRKVGSLLGTGLLLFAAICVSAIGFFIPALIIGVMFMFWTHVIVIENRGGITALRRSSFLIANYWWKALLTVLFGGVFAMGLSAFPRIAAELSKSYMDDVVYRVIGSCAEYAGLIISMPVCAVLLTVLYYDIRVRKEGLDIECSCDTLWP